MATDHIIYLLVIVGSIHPTCQLTAFLSCGSGQPPYPPLFSSAPDQHTNKFQAKDCPKSGNPVCYNCGHDGHLSKDCQEPEKEKSCYNCGKAGHLLRECKEEPRKAVVIVPGASSTETEASVSGSASTTSGSGAVSVSLPGTSSSNENPDAAASSLEDSESAAASSAGTAVPTGPATSSLVECYKCGKTGHIARNCNSRGFRKQCYSCGGFGHLSKDCRQGQKCYKCGEMGHVSKDCAHADQDKVCYVCKLPGHVASQCPQSTSNNTSSDVGSGADSEASQLANQEVTAPIISSSPAIVKAESA
ncbi:Gis2p [Sugiyamaella lignohabitans]|uniref:Gis2p n=1 Tax=Sugiyamaella lignohabitans TaxID=796027 RepID=A0A167DXD0_9ASCO|nr:Gis2p [Sugiyamaella lignohabitans]ANB13408.1 Gis2p [Sugiyamaella lignohabitans]